MPQQTPKTFIPDAPEPSSAPKSFVPDAAQPKKHSGVLDLAKALAGVVVDPQGRVGPDVKDFLAEGTIGAAKGAGRMTRDLARVVAPSSAGAWAQLESVDPNAPNLKPEGTAQTLGSFIPDAVVAAVTGGAGAGRAARSTANIMERSAMPGLTREGAAMNLGGGGRLSAANAARARAAAQPRTLTSGATVTPNATVQNVAESMTNAVKNTKPFSFNDLAMPAGVGWLLGPHAGTATAALRILNRPGVKSAAAHGINAASPVLGATGAGAAGGVARYLMSLLGGGQ